MPRRLLAHALRQADARHHTAVLVALLLAAVPLTTEASRVGPLLEAVAARARYAVPTRADVRIMCTPACETTRAILLARDDRVYVELPDGLRALVRPGSVLVAGEARGGAAKVGQTLGDTGLLLEDLAVFDAGSLRVPQISDESPAEVVVTAAPARVSAYALLVHTIDPTESRIAKTLYYEGTVSNLAKLQWRSAWVPVGNGTRPGKITVESLRLATTTILELSWREAPDVPAALFEPDGLAKPSGLAWP